MGEAVLLLLLLALQKFDLGHFLNSFTSLDLQFTYHIMQASAAEADEQHRPANHKSLFPIAARCHVYNLRCVPLFCLLEKLSQVKERGL
jgi:hypothetical protein